MRVSIIGAGYVGLVSAACLAEKGQKVVCVDVDPQKIAKINQAKPHIFERGLEDLLKRNLNVTLEATTDLHRAVMETAISFITVDTPFDGKKIDLSYIKEASRQVGAVLKDKLHYHLVVIKSTVTPGTTDEIVVPILERASGRKAGLDFGVGVNPEFLREGSAIEDFMNPDRIILGGIDDKSTSLLSELYSAFTGAEQLKTNNKTAEMIKYISNSLFATMISFSNEVGNLCSAIGVDAIEAMKAVHFDRRLSPIAADGSRITPDFTTYLEAGCGFGGSCFPKDVQSLIAYGEEKGIPMRILKNVKIVNEEQPHRIISLLKKHYPYLKNLMVAVLGLAFKPGTDDVRKSPAIPIIKSMLQEGVKIKAYDPAAKNNAQKLLAGYDILFCDNLVQSISGVQAVILLTRWSEFENIPKLLAQMNPQPLVIDGRRMLNKHSVKRYDGIGL